MRRRTVLAGLLGLAMPVQARAQGAAGMRRLAVLDDGDEMGRAHLWRGFFLRLRNLGYEQGRNLVVERRWADTSAARLPDLAGELVAAGPDVIVANSTSTTRAVMRRTASIPIVFVNVGNPVGAGLVSSLARPGGNVTGLSIQGAETHSKRLEVLSEVLPAATRFGFLGPASNDSILSSYQQLQKTARAKKLTVRLLDAGDRDAISRIFGSFASAPVDGLVVASMLLPHRRHVTGLAARHRVPAIYAYDDFLDAGGLIAFGPDLADLYRRAADYVHRILQGSRPGDLPVEQPTTLALGVNLQTARALGLVIPRSVLIRADRVIE